MKKTLFFGMCLLLTTWGCSDNEVTEVADSQPTPIQFSTYVQQATRGNVADYTTLQSKGFGVFAKTVSGSADYIVNNQVTYDERGFWDPSQVYLWPTTALNFYAYSPYSEKDNTATEVSHEVAGEVASQVDLLMASNTGSNGGGLTYSSASEGKVPFTFGHALSRIGISVTSTDKLEYVIEITEVKISGKFIKKGKLDLTKDLSSAWSGDAETTDVDYNLLKSGTVFVPTYSSANNTVYIPESTGYYLMTIPSGSTGISDFKISLTFKATSNGFTITNEGRITYTPSDAPVFAAGKAYTYNFNLGKLYWGINSTGDTEVDMPFGIGWDVNTTVTPWGNPTVTDIAVETN